jgi:hypothetical protein
MAKEGKSAQSEQYALEAIRLLKKPCEAGEFKDRCNLSHMEKDN